MDQKNIFEERFLQIEVVGDVAILRELLPGSKPVVLMSGSRDEILAKLNEVLVVR